MLYPPSLQSGDRIAIVSPAGAIDPNFVHDARKLFESWGLEVVLGNHLFGEYGRYSGTVQERLNDLQWALDDPDIHAVLCSRGGYGVVHLMDKISWEGFKNKPKWLFGYSDITILHLAISRLGICSIHSLMASHISNEGEDQAVLYLKNALFGKMPEYKLAPHPLNRPGKSEGFTCGGNLAVFHGLRGTALDLDPKNLILFIEDIGEKPYQIDRMMYNLKLGGVLSSLSGLIVGRFTEFEEDPLMNGSLYELIADLVSEYDYPVCFDFPLGHIKENFPLIENGRAVFEVDDSGVTLSYR